MKQFIGNNELMNERGALDKEVTIKLFTILWYYMFSYSCGSAIPIAQCIKITQKQTNISGHQYSPHLSHCNLSCFQKWIVFPTLSRSFYWEGKKQTWLLSFKVILNIWYGSRLNCWELHHALMVIVRSFLVNDFGVDPQRGLAIAASQNAQLRCWSLKGSAISSLWPFLCLYNKWESSLFPLCTILSRKWTISCIPDAKIS